MWHNRIARRMLCAVLAACLCILPGCRKSEPKAVSANVSLMVGGDALEGVFSPFFAELESDRDIVDLTQIRLLYTDRAGQVICNGIEGETTMYNDTEYTYTGPANVVITECEDGSVEYAFTLREDITFSDGQPLTAKDVVFSMYVLCDPTYDGSSSFASLPIQGLSDYRKNVTPKWKLILKDTPSNAINGSKDGYYTVDEALSFWTLFNEAGAEFAQEIVDDGIARGIGSDVRGVAAALGYVGLSETASATDFFNAIVDARGYDISAAGINAPAVKNDFSSLLMSRLTSTLQRGVVTGYSAPRISGIRQTGDYTLTVMLTRADAYALEQFCIPIAPLHYYGSEQMYSPESGTFGFSKGNLSAIRSKSAKPRGAGPYVYYSYKDGKLTLKANATYYRGVPKTGYVVYTPMDEAERTAQVSSGKLHLTQVEYTPEAVDKIEQTNGGVLSGDTVRVDSFWSKGYGYVGISADRIRVGNDSGSNVSRSLRQALATVFTAYHKESVVAYYNDYADCVSAFDGLSAYATDAQGQPLDLSSLSEEEQYLRLQDAVLSHFAAAGYTVENRYIIAAPEAAPLQFGVWFAGGGDGNHPAYEMLTQAQYLLGQIGITLELHDVEDDVQLRTYIASGEAAIWCGRSSDDYYQDLYAYYTATGSIRSSLDINDKELKSLIVSAQRETDAEAREEIYQKIRETVLAWAVEVPLYECQQLQVFNATKVDMSTVTRDATPYHDWIDEIEKLVIKG